MVISSVFRAKRSFFSYLFSLRGFVASCEIQSYIMMYVVQYQPLFFHPIFCYVSDINYNEQISQDHPSP
jgi:hypothetical protein